LTDAPFAGGINQPEFKFLPKPEKKLRAVIESLKKRRVRYWDCFLGSPSER
jgi:hypothetical protein